MSPRANETVSSDVLFRSLMDWVLQLPHVTQATHRMGGTELRVHGLEFMHSHGPSFLDVRLSPKEQARVLRESKAEHHRADVHHHEGWVSFRIEGKESVERAKELVQLAYDDAKGQVSVHEGKGPQRLPRKQSSRLYLLSVFFSILSRGKAWSIVARGKAPYAIVVSPVLPSQVKGAGLRTLSRRGSWVRIPPPAPISCVMS